MHSSLAKRWYGLAAPIYELLKKLFFPRIDSITDECVVAIPPANEILIVGGGSGNVLKRFRQRFPDSHISFLDISEEMIALARKKDEAVTFIHEDFFRFQPYKTYDLVFFPFFLDHFSEAELLNIAYRTHCLLNKNGTVALVDFHYQNKQIALRIALKLARVLLGLSITKLANPIPAFANCFPEVVMYQEDESNKYFFTILRKKCRNNHSC